MKEVKWRSLIKLILFYLLFLNPSFSKDLNIPSSINFELTNSNYNKYIRSSMKAYTDGEVYGESNIKKKYKRWIKSKIVIDQKTIDAEIRILGDLKDHLRPPQTSLKVKVLDDSYYGITRFNLFLPETREGENEIFWTLMLKYLGFPSLFTRIVNVNLNGEIYKAIFQEDATKEFLERNNLTETVILKRNDFEFYLSVDEQAVYNNFFHSSFLIDNSNFLDNNTAQFIVSEAIALRSNINFKKKIINNKFFEAIHKKYAPHGLSVKNRKYIYIPYKKIFIPLYYDGNVQIIPGKVSCDKPIEKKILIRFKEEYKILVNKDLDKSQECALRDIFSLSEGNIEKLSNFFNNKEADNKKVEGYTEIKNKIINYLKNNKIDNLKNLSKKNEKTIIYSFIYNDKPFSCLYKISEDIINSCYQIDSITYNKLISQSGRFEIKNNFKSFPINLGSFNQEIPIIRLNDQAKEYEISEKATYYFIKQNRQDENIKFNFYNNESKLFIQGEFKNVNFEFENKVNVLTNKFDDARYDKNLLTGCANFFDSNFINVSLKSSGMNCEDSINIKNSYGNIDKIEINNSLFDALDLDFSNISIKNLLVNNAKNDCIDFSFGDYKVHQANLNNCGDKGVSIGERSKFNLKEGKIFNSKIGIASKDDATTEIDKILINNIDICLAAYNKKKEFEGSRIFVKEILCKNYEKFQQADDLSKISILNKL